MERSFNATVFTKNRQRLLEHQVGQQLFDEVVLAADRRSLLSDEHFTVDGRLIEVAASLKSFKPRDADPPPDDGDRGNSSVDFAGERSDGDGGAGCGPGAAGRGARTRVPSSDARRGRGLRHAGLREGHARPRGHPARGAKHERALQRYRWMHDPASRLCVESASEEASRGDLRVDEDGGRVPEDALPRSGPHGPCRLPRGDSLQPGADGRVADF